MCADQKKLYSLYIVAERHSYIHIKSISATVFTSIYIHIYFLPSPFSRFYNFNFFFNIYPSLPFALSHHTLFVSPLLFPLPSSLTPFLFLSVLCHLLYISILISFLTPSHFTLPTFLSVFPLSFLPPLCFSTFPSCLSLVKFSLIFSLNSLLLFLSFPPLHVY